ncbi:hypothetical protein GCM10009678_82960 [Actinomadura kijaniata]|uniref:Uncharacterized protein n=1 Tax=Actinomadura namibiensis TaxID=182080 RepID=A0A7W3QSA8_ACTNM|nr:hypothetical protein [Actinomadura namibiensis]
MAGPARVPGHGGATAPEPIADLLMSQVRVRLGQREHTVAGEGEAVCAGAWTSPALAR